MRVWANVTTTRWVPPARLWPDKEIYHREPVVPPLECAMNATINIRSLELQTLIRQRKTAIRTFFLGMYPSIFSDLASIPDAEQIWDQTVFSQLLTAVQERFFRVE